MVSSSVNALGIIFPNSYDSRVPELVAERSMASIPFASRYRMVDFILSSMVNSGISNVSILVKNNYHSLMDHLGAGREWDLTRKNGGLNIVPPFAEKNVKVYNGRVEALASVLRFLRAQKEKYVVMADSMLAANIDIADIVDRHVSSGADITMVYGKRELSRNLLEKNVENGELYYTVNIDDDNRVTDIHICPKDTGELNLSMNIYVISRELLIDQISNAYVKGYVFYERDVLVPALKNFKVMAYEYTGYVAMIDGISSYFTENMRLLNEKNSDELFGVRPVYTKIRDDNPTRYIGAAKANNLMVADGCIIEGEVENCVIFRGVHIKKGAKVKNCVLMQDTVVGENADVSYVITDKNVHIMDHSNINGTSEFPVFVAKGKRV